MYNAIIKFAGKVPSVNIMYLTNRHGGKYLNPEVAEFKSFIRTALIKQNCKDYFTEEIRNNSVLEVELIFVLKKDFWKRDCTNMIKALEDATAEAIGIDDRFNMRVASSKVENDRDNFEYIIIVINPKDKSTYPSKWSQIL